MKTYVLAGFDHNGAFKQDLAFYSKDKNVEIIYPKKGESFDVAMSKIQAPANIIVACHGGSDGRFVWSKYEQPGYGALFSKLPRSGIDTVSIGSCYGELSQNFLETIPAGTVVLSLVGAKVVGWSNTSQASRYSVESKNINRPVDLVLEALDNVSPTKWSQFARDYNKNYRKKGEQKLNENSNDVLPHLIAVGGKPPIQINTVNEVHAILENGPQGNIDLNAFSRAIQLVQKRFDTNVGDGSKGEQAEKALDARIAKIGSLMLQGKHPHPYTAEDAKIEYALAVGYLDTSGKMDQMIAQGKKSQNLYDNKQKQELADLVNKLKNESALTPIPKQPVGESAEKSSLAEKENIEKLLDHEMLKKMLDAVREPAKHAHSVYKIPSPEIPLLIKGQEVRFEVLTCRMDDVVGPKISTNTLHAAPKQMI